MSLKHVKHTLNSVTFKHLFATSVKLSGNNYLLWAQSFCLFVGSHKKQQHLTDDPPAKDTLAYADWVASECSAMFWLINSMTEKISAGIMLLKAAKVIWDILKEMYSNEQIISRVADLYEILFSLRQDGCSLTNYSEMKGILDVLDFHWPLILDLKALQRYCDELAIAKFLSRLDASLEDQVRGQTFGGDTFPPSSHYFVSCAL